MLNKATTAGPLPTHNNNHSRSGAFNKFQRFPGIFFFFFFFAFSSHHFASVPAPPQEVDDSEISIRSAFVGPDSYQRLSSSLIGVSRLRSDAALCIPLRVFISTSLSSSANTRRRRFDARRRRSHVLAACRQVGGVTRYPPSRNPRSGRLFNFKFQHTCSTVPFKLSAAEAKEQNAEVRWFHTRLVAVVDESI